jgi:hypothetical protein
MNTIIVQIIVQESMTQQLSNVIMDGFITRFCTIICILPVIQHPDNGHKHD